jgi:hypothetical protein
MVATDVASRGIGMIEIPPSPSRLQCPVLFHGALLSTLRRFLDCVTLPGFSSSHGSLSEGILDLWCSIFSLATLVISYTMYCEDT